ncbi:NAD(P)-dependent oxidoreductase [Undibacterium sp. TS12]|uniref:NAD-dependent epimerase/dehydratase family protein n=1 Tax=Undibacterium sp. TS12 TaxID=2908202 RepID=UPI001F4C9E41|nr:NAD(P)-dependent oxidoreductase [Undibacterium sp. TS12]MCH8619715.1 NAD(P)-dependent oxidoreductase [Undibacterium sp. TS12]
MKILITGGTGFLGRHLVWHLAGQGHEVIFTGRQQVLAQSIIGKIKTGSGDAEFVAMEHGGLQAQAILCRAAEGADAIIHSAALTSPWGAADLFERANIASTREVLAAAQVNRVNTLVHISSPSVYFDFKDQLDIPEAQPLPDGVNAYARSKRVAEQLVQAANLPHRVILRPRAIFGPWDNALLPRLLRLIQYGRVPLMRQGQALLDMTYVENVVQAVMLSLALSPAPAPTAQVFNISNGEPLAVAALFDRLAQEFGMTIKTVQRPYWLADLMARGLETLAQARPGWEPPFTRYSLATIAYSQTLDLRRARQVLGYQPAVSLADGIRRTAQWRKTEGRLT